MKKRALCIILSALLLLLSAGCTTASGNNSSGSLEEYTPVSKKAQLQLLACFSDTLNPYTATTTINKEVCSLLYDSLVYLNDEFEVVYGLAESVEVENTQITVTLKNAVFSDGTKLTADDVVYSFNTAKNSSSEYSHNLYVFSAASAVNGTTVSFSLSKRDPYAANLLDFPIIKSGSDKIADADGVVFEPIGSGRYILTDDKSTLKRNEKYYGKKGTVLEIKLINAPDAESVAHYVEIGATDVYFTDVQDGNIVRMSGKKSDVNMSNLVYIGVNDASAMLASPYIRYAISTAISRTDICKNAYYNNAVAANGIFHPAFAPTKSFQNIKKDADLKIAIENLEKIGYNKPDSSKYFVNASGKHLVLSLLVNSENQSKVLAAEQIAKQLEALGIEIRVVKRSYEGYLAALQSGDFQLYLGEIKLTANMDLSALLLPGGSAAYGRVEQGGEPEGDKPEAEQEDVGEKNPSTAYYKIISGFYEGQYSIADVSSVLLTQLPIIPVCYRNGLLFYDADILDLSNASYNEIYRSKEIGYSSYE